MFLYFYFYFKLYTNIHFQADKIHEQQEFEHLKSKHIGLGNSDTSRDEWIRNIHRDTYSSLAGHSPSVDYISTALNKPKVQVKADLIEKMIQPVEPRGKS
ncbi:unnamed protein product [Kuraishia capsulata CBS 1993]|uniref:Splicing factor subunit n=1 Tax=Kuraishia capsulata CBS 1993 TaxID=1382522 RepID=W6MHQ4_9ASCO|nr:uncharacterized protein KUCA_T00001287001 [Kuraishia capsulata CBS 1993]CDK25318.1 unnamed protein product [Kuraishia capsulata CBS 1993]